VPIHLNTTPIHTSYCIIASRLNDFTSIIQDVIRTDIVYFVMIHFYQS
jgi:hypothetical protein